LATLTVNGRIVQVGDFVATAVSSIVRDYGGIVDLDNGQAEGPFVAYGFPRHRPVQIGVRLNKSKLTLYVRERVPEGRLLAEVVPDLMIEDRYDLKSKAPVHGIRDGRVRYLKLSETPVLRVKIQPHQLKSVLDACLGVAASMPETLPSASVASAPVVQTTSQVQMGGSRAPESRQPLTPDELLTQLERRSETGVRGEQVALTYEMTRLDRCGCPAPKDFVRHIALDDVGAGYDIETSWPGQERCIEVKTTASSAAEFFISANERKVLADKGAGAWIYRVDLDADGVGKVVEIRDPMKRIPADHFTPNMWRVRTPTANSEE